MPGCLASFFCMLGLYESKLSTATAYKNQELKEFLIFNVS